MGLRFANSSGVIAFLASAMASLRKFATVCGESSMYSSTPSSNRASSGWSWSDARDASAEASARPPRPTHTVASARHITARRPTPNARDRRNGSMSIAVRRPLGRAIATTTARVVVARARAIPSCFAS